MRGRENKYLKNSTKVNLYPCCSATPAQTTFAEAPIKVPFPIIIFQKLSNKIHKKN
jgi:hypothetical protein